MEHINSTAKPGTNASQDHLVVVSLSENFVNQNLSESEKLELNALEGMVQRGLRAFWEIGKALHQIRDKRLYRFSYETFEEYCINRWEMSRRSAYYLIEASLVYDNVNHGSQILPANERQARPLTALTPSQQRKVWSQVIATAPNGKITAIHVDKVVKEFQSTNGVSKFKANGTKTARKEPTPEIPVVNNLNCEPNLRSCWNCSYCSPESLEQKEQFYCYKLGKIDFLETDGETQASQCEFWVHRFLEPEPTETIPLTLHVPAYLQPLMQDIIEANGLTIAQWAIKVLTEAIFTKHPGYEMLTKKEAFDTLREPVAIS